MDKDGTPEEYIDRLRTRETIISLIIRGKPEFEGLNFELFTTEQLKMLLETIIKEREEGQDKQA